MPKKGKGKKKGGKGKGNKEDGPPPPKVSAEEQPLNELSRQFYAIQIKDLEGRVGRYQERCVALQASNDELLKQHSQQEENQEQVIQFLKKTTKEKSEHNLELEGELVALKQVREREREQFEGQLAQLKEESRRAQDKLQVDNSVLQGQLEALEEFRESKERLEQEGRQKEAEIERLKAEQEEVVYSLEKKSVLDRDRMKKEMVSKVNSVAAEFRKVSDLQMVETTKRTIRENVSISQQMGKMSEKTMTLLRENEALRMKERELGRRVELLENSDREINRKNVSNQKVMVMLQEKVMEQERELAELRHRAAQCGVLERQAREAMQHATSATSDSKLHCERARAVEDELASVQGQLTETRRELHRLKAILTSSAHAIHTALQRSDSEAEHVSQREGLMATLLKLLNTCPPTTSTCTTSTSPAAHFRLVPITSYKPGDLGIVPSLGANRKEHPPNYSVKLTPLSNPVESAVGKDR